MPAGRPEKREDTVPADLTPDPAHKPPTTADPTPAGDSDHDLMAPSTGPSTTTSPTGRVSAAQT
ncbi:hypothetical protein OG705_00170 [Streptomyces sp. NBC_00838]|uniref:hypothetical protein n=1 Tax=Streptomyces sp. NBC_00838 TaxID=2903680 RepID=UPI0038702B1C|nr:hypothetical protein OG705_00170 [Streptomyces sp. NBC_00838]